MFTRSYKTPTGQVYQPFEVLADQPHVLIAGATGSGKSVTINGIITTLLIKESPNNCQFVLIDPKRVELVQYIDLPHTIGYASENADIVRLLQWAVKETERRFSVMQKQKVKEYTGGHLYIIVDELADLMLTNKKACQPLLQRLLQLGRAAKIHCILASQCILCEVIPTVLKCNLPVIVGLRTANKAQSRYLVQCEGCESLPDPKTTGEGYSLIRDGADLYKVKIYKYQDSVVNGVIKYWTSGKCIA